LTPLSAVKALDLVYGRVSGVGYRGSGVGELGLRKKLAARAATG